MFKVKRLFSINKKLNQVKIDITFPSHAEKHLECVM
ncbi:MAG: hypothetical protein ACI8Q2_000602 [Candidatus Omnitrophota bacterium]|jgi:hypothetical protein